MIFINLKIEASNDKLKIGFGSCIDQNKSQEVWNSIEREKLSDFFFMGDNVYGDVGSGALNHMKKAYLSFNKDSVDNKTILSHLKILSKGQLSVPENFDFIESKSVNKNKKPIYKKKFKKRK